MNAQQIIYEQSAIDEEVKRIADRLGFEAVYDGVISPEHYVLRPIKVSWILREPHDSGGDYDYKEDIIDKLSKNKIGRSKYFDPMRYLEYSLDNNLTFYEDIPNSDEDVNISNMLLNTAFTNISKIVGGARVRDWGIFWQNVEIFSSVVKRQIEIANPTIIVASGTIGQFPEM